MIRQTSWVHGKKRILGIVSGLGTDYTPSYVQVPQANALQDHSQIAQATRAPLVQLAARLLNLGQLAARLASLASMHLSLQL